MRRCPYCDVEIQCHDIYCFSCKRRVQQYFSISIFLKENFHLFTIIGVIGTMISLLPNIGEKIIGPEWVSGSQGINFVSAIIFGCLFLFGIFAITIRHIWVDCRSDEKDCRYWILTLKQGDKLRILLTMALTCMILSFISYILMSAISIKDIYPQIAIFVFAFLLLLGWTIYLFYDLLRTTIDDIKNDRLELVVVLFLFIIAGLCIYPSMIPPNIPPVNPSNVIIQSTPSYYSPLSSPEKGIFLSTTNTSWPKYNICTYHWNANYGYFIAVKKTTDAITILGNETDGYTSIYWTFSALDVEKEKPPVIISLDILDPSNYSVITRSTINISWFNNEIAKTQ